MFLQRLTLSLGLLLLAGASPSRGQEDLPRFGSAAAARAWGEARERAGQYETAGRAYLEEAALRAATGDPQGAEVERRRAHRLMTDLALAISVPAGPPSHSLARLEPAAGCYLGVLDAYPGGRMGNADAFERRVGRPIAVAFDYARYGQAFPLGWARAQASRGRAIQIAWEPSGGLGGVQDDAYLNRWASDAARCGTSVFLRFAGEMNGDWTRWGRDPADYKRAFRLVHSVIARHAANVAMVWAPNAVPVTGVDAYYPGDDAVDWVGISLYLVRFYDDNLRRPAWQDHPATFIEPFYRRYAGRKPFCLVECGVTRRSRVEGADADPFASARIQDLFDAVRVRFPRLKMVCWFDRDNLTGARPERRLNDYSLPEGSQALAGYQTATADPYFLGRLNEQSERGYARVSTRLSPRYGGSVIGSLSTYALDSALQVSQGGAPRRVTRPFRFFADPGRSPIIVTVRDKKGRTAATGRLTRIP